MTENDLEVIAKNRELIIDWIDANDMSKYAMARAIGKVPNWFYNWLRGGTNHISAETLLKIGNITGITFNKNCPTCGHGMEIEPTILVVKNRVESFDEVPLESQKEEE